jgi:uncharacterized membrane protein (UPF0182 family)
MLKAWMGAFPGTVQPMSDISAGLMAHLRYPEDLFKVQRSVLAKYHVLDPKTFYEANDQWEIPEDPTISTPQLQPPYRLSVATKSGEKPVFSLTSLFTPVKKQNLAAFISVGADATDPSTYGKFQILRLPENSQVPGPSQIANNFSSASKIANKILAFKRQGTTVENGNLLTLPVGGGLLYVQPVYTLREGGSGNYPVLQFVLASFGKQVGIGANLSGALSDVLGSTGGQVPGTTPNPPSTGGTGLPTAAFKLLQQAQDKFTLADKALKAGNLSLYARYIDEGRQKVDQALSAGPKKKS